ncbi:MAG: ATP-binding protein [Christensenellaceae bacterium]|nr:ATP-binding protein [Christensenellaceae bacterium]MEA5064688.1 ATP-binding protein [Eubacteriales bacterium]MEA5067697.1 ATP-binding protein [Christensenellaceae bacterium]
MKQLLVLSGKGGTGKTTIASALIHLSDAKRFADCDVDAPNLHLSIQIPPEKAEEDYYGLPKAQIDEGECGRCGLCMSLCRFDAISRLEDGRYRIDPAACEGCALCEAVCESRAISMQPAITGRLVAYRGDGRFFSTASLRMGSGNSGKLVSVVKKKLLESGAAGRFAVIDGSPGIGCPVIASVSGVDMVLIVAEPTLSGVSDMERVLKTAFRLGVKCAVCVNKSDVNERIADEIESFCGKAKIPFVGRVPYDRSVVEAVNAGVDVVDRGGSAARAIEALHGRVSALLRESEEAE